MCLIEWYGGLILANNVRVGRTNTSAIRCVHSRCDQGFCSCSTDTDTFSLTLAFTGLQYRRHVPDVLPFTWIASEGTAGATRRSRLYGNPAEAFTSVDGIFRKNCPSVNEDSAFGKLILFHRYVKHQDCKL